MMRAMLYEAAQILLVRTTKWFWLRAWAMTIARRRGLKKAIGALARRLAVIMHRMGRWHRVPVPRMMTPVPVTNRSGDIIPSSLVAANKILPRQNPHTQENVRSGSGIHRAAGIADE
jgi:hypothetical protein